MQRFIFVISSSLLLANSLSAQSVRVTDLQCEYLHDPIGIDNAHPRLRWQIAGTDKDVFQKSYQIVAGTDSSEILNKKGNAWQTRKTDSAGNLVVYQGKALVPFTRYYWNVAVQLNNNKQITSPVQSFETGMLSVSEWKGFWISDGQDINRKPAPYFRKIFICKKY